MNFSYGIIAAVGILVAGILGMIAIDPDYLEGMPVEPVSEPITPMTEGSKIHTVTIAIGSSTPGCDEINECFLPDSVNVSVDDTVIWKNADSASHTVTSGMMPEGPSGVFDSGLFMSGSTFEFTFTKTGTYDYYCMVHPWMKGKITVV